MTTLAPALTFGDWYQTVYKLYQEKDYAKGLDLALTEGEHYMPDNAHLLYHYRACMQSLLGKKDDALNSLQSALDAGFWYSERYMDDDDFVNIREDPKFIKLRAENDKRYEAAKAEAKPQLKIHAPDNIDEALPLLVGLHGNNSNIDGVVHQWTPATDYGWLVATPQSSQIVRPDGYVWNDDDVADKEISTHLAEIKSKYDVDASKIVLGGFSRGGHAVMRQVMSGVIPSKGFIAVAPGGQGFGESETWEPLIESAKKLGVRGYFIIGKKDGGYENITKVAKQLKDGGIPVEVIEYVDIGHVFPHDFADKLPDMLEWILNG